MNTEVATQAESKRNRPWWIPTLYFAEGLPYFAVNTLAVAFYTNLGIDVAQMAFWTSLLSLPWVIKPFWSPIVDSVATKRKWVLGMQLIITCLFFALAFFSILPFYFAITLAVFFLMAFLSATHDIAADGYYMLALTHHQQAAFSGLRNAFYRVGSLFSQGGMLWLAGILVSWFGFSQQESWSVVFGVMGVAFGLIYLADRFLMYRPKEDRHRSSENFWSDFAESFVTFFCRRDILVGLFFMLFYRIPEAFLTKILIPFFLAPRAEGGMGLTNEDVGLAYGLVGVLALLAGGIIGGICISRGGLKKWLYWMALALTVPSSFYCYLAMTQPTSLWLLNIGIAIEQFGYGFGFTAYMLYLILFSEGKYKTSHYAFCTGFMALGMMLPGMISGHILKWLSNFSFFFSGTGATDYVNYFWFMMLTSVFTFAACGLVKIPASFGKKTAEER